MIGRTLFGYIATRYFKTVLGMMVSLLLLIIMVAALEVSGLLQFLG